MKTLFLFSFLLIGLIGQVASQVWPAPISLSITSNWGNGLCGNIVIQNPSTASTAQSFIATMKICKGSITSTWGGWLVNSILLSKDDSTETYLFTGEGKSIGPGSTYQEIGFCMSNEVTFDVTQSIILGVDMRTASTVDCSGYDCLLECGDGICTTCESKSLCAIDCQPNQCYVDLTPPTVDVWPGRFTYVTSSSSFPYICIDLYVTNPSTTKTALAHMLTLKTCYPKVQITSFWGSVDQKMISYDGINAGLYRQITNDVNYLPGMTYNIGGICLYASSGFNVDKHMWFMVDLRSDRNLCTTDTCPITCGSGTCTAGETATNCKLDCVPWTCS